MEIPWEKDKLVVLNKPDLDTPWARPHLGQLNLGAQGKFRRVLFVCSGGMLRSATAAQWAHKVLGWNTRNCGTYDCALPPAHPNVVEWAEQIYCMEEEHKEYMEWQFPWAKDKLIVLNIPDQYSYQSDGLIAELEARLNVTRA